ncbi:MAG TPA: hypothetical protein VFJ16_11995 [Longimicrobium sp.]|nr:hypothetical protein [Longimicrobium sp.]
MSIHEPNRVGSTADEPPEVIWNVLVEVEFDPRLSAPEIDAIQAKLWDRLNDAIRKTVRPHTCHPASPLISAVNGRGEDTPILPMVAGQRQFTCNLDIEEAAERTCGGTDLAKLAHDARGRAYELGVAIQYQRRPEFDGVRTAWMPRPAKVARTERRRTRRKPSVR